MRFDSLLVDIAATPAYLLLVFCVLTVVLHIVLVWRMTLSDIAWKRVDYIWLGAAAIGLLGASGHADRYISAQLANDLEEPRTASAYRWFRAQVESAANTDSGVCSERVRSTSPPPDFDQIAQEQKRQCAYFRTLVEAIPRDVQPPFPSLIELGYTEYQGSLQHEKWYVRQSRDNAASYEAQRQLYLQRKSSSEVSAVDNTVTMLGPLLVCFALALRVTKVTGEIANARRKLADKLP